MRVIFFGTGAFAAPSLEHLVEARHQVLACVTQPDRPRGRGLRVEASEVKTAATRLGLKVLQPERLDADVLASLAPDVGVVIDYGRILQRELLQMPTHGMLGVHPSLLPKYRGASPVAWAILEGQRKTGVTVFRLNERMDAGDILRQRKASFADGDTVETLTNRLAQLGAEELVRGLEDLAAGRASFAPQDETQASVTRKFTKDDGVIDWTQPAERLDRIIRAMGSWPGASTFWQGQSLKIMDAGVGSAVGQRAAAPGTIVRVSPEGIDVATGAGTLLIREVQPAGRRRMSVREFLAGRAVQAGERFGE